MELETIFSRFNPWWQEPYQAPGIRREKYLAPLLQEARQKRITFVTGLRRVGKTTILRQAIGRLLEQGIPPQKIFFLSLDHSSLRRFTLLDLVEKYREQRGLSVKEKVYLFFDEVQYFEQAERDLKVLHDHEKVKIFASGSNSLVLKDKNAFLTGRNKNVIINPLTFEEYLLFRDLTITAVDPQLFQHHFADYLEYGGMPEYVLTQDPEKITNLVSNIIYKDIIGKHGIKNAGKLEELFLLLCERVGKRLTYNKLAAIVGIDVETVSSYLSYFEEVFLVYSINRYARSLNEVVRSPKKIYLADMGIRNVYMGLRDKGALWENLVFLTIKDKKVSYYYEQEQEIDFIIEFPREKRVIAVEAKYRDLLPGEELQALKKFKEHLLVSSPADLEKLGKLF